MPDPVAAGVAVQHRVLEALGSAQNYNRWLADLAFPYLGEHPLEIGSGIGTFSQLWLDAGLPALTVSELDDELVESLRARFSDDPRVSVCALDLLDAGDAQYSAVVALNVLEHIEDDREALRAARRLVRNDGAIVVFVPAFEFAMSRFDRAIGHHRRYTRASMHETLVSAGLVPEVVRYVNAPGLLAWMLGMRLLRMTPSDGPVLRAWDRFVVPSVRRVERRLTPPFGQSVFAVGRAPR